jgi:hypothetical protein
VLEGPAIMLVGVSTEVSTGVGFKAEALARTCASELCHQIGIPSPLTLVATVALFIVGVPVSQLRPYKVGERNVTA